MMDYPSLFELWQVCITVGGLTCMGIMRLDDQPAPPPVPAPNPKPPAPDPPRTGLVYHPDCLQHDTGPTHPEKPERLTAIMAGLQAAGLLERLSLITPQPAADQWLTAVHTPEYIAEVEHIPDNHATYLHSSDTPVSSKSPAAARLAAGGILAGIDAIMAGRIANAFCAVRPPGHHAGGNQTAGFCIFNNAAIGARYIQRHHHLKRVLIVDWDVHHGNGTQTLFYDDPNVMLFSVHQHPFYPGTGAASESGAAAGAGFTINVPLPAGSGDAEYMQAFEEVLRPRAMEFHPEFVLISAGFDAQEHDPLGGMRVTTQGFATMTRVVRQIAAQACRGRLVSVLEGGYHLENLPAAVTAHLAELMPPG